MRQSSLFLAGKMRQGLEKGRYLLHYQKEHLKMYEFKTLGNSDISALTEAWNRCWQGYFYEMLFTEENLKVWIFRGMIQLDHSIALTENGKIIGFSFLGQAGYDGWIGGTAIDPRYRGNRLFVPMLKAQIELARALGLKQLYLEVLSQNYAQHSYQAVGFKFLRPLYIYRIKPGMLNLANSQDSDNFQKVETSAYFLARQKGQFVPSWQRREDYLNRYPSLNAWLNPEGTSGMLYAEMKGSPLIDAWAPSDQSAQELLSVLNQRNNGEFSLTNQPPDSITQTLSLTEIRPTDLQYEMVCSLI